LRRARAGLQCVQSGLGVCGLGKVNLVTCVCVSQAGIRLLESWAGGHVAVAYKELVSWKWRGADQVRKPSWMMPATQHFTDNECSKLEGE
jgi:hypothetical protein